MKAGSKILLALKGMVQSSRRIGGSGVAKKSDSAQGIGGSGGFSSILGLFSEALKGATVRRVVPGAASNLRGLEAGPGKEKVRAPEVESVGEGKELLDLGSNRVPHIEGKGEGTVHPTFQGLGGSSVEGSGEKRLVLSPVARVSGMVEASREENPSVGAETSFWGSSEHGVGVGDFHGHGKIKGSVPKTWAVQPTSKDGGYGGTEKALRGPAPFLLSQSGGDVFQDGEVSGKLFLSSSHEDTGKVGGYRLRGLGHVLKKGGVEGLAQPVDRSGGVESEVRAEKGSLDISRDGEIPGKPFPSSSREDTGKAGGFRLRRLGHILRKRSVEGLVQPVDHSGGVESEVRAKKGSFLGSRCDFPGFVDDGSQGKVSTHLGSVSHQVAGSKKDEVSAKPGLRRAGSIVRKPLVFGAEKGAAKHPDKGIAHEVSREEGTVNAKPHLGKDRDGSGQRIGSTRVGGVKVPLEGLYRNSAPDSGQGVVGEELPLEKTNLNVKPSARVTSGTASTKKVKETGFVAATENHAHPEGSDVKHGSKVEVLKGGIADSVGFTKKVGGSGISDPAPSEDSKDVHGSKQVGEFWGARKVSSFSADPVKPEGKVQVRRGEVLPGAFKALKVSPSGKTYSRVRFYGSVKDRVGSGGYRAPYVFDEGSKGALNGSSGVRFEFTGRPEVRHQDDWQGALQTKSVFPKAVGGGNSKPTSEPYPYKSLHTKTPSRVISKQGLEFSVKGVQKVGVEAGNSRGDVLLGSEFPLSRGSSLGTLSVVDERFANKKDRVSSGVSGSAASEVPSHGSTENVRETGKLHVLDTSNRGSFLEHVSRVVSGLSERGGRVTVSLRPPSLGRLRITVGIEGGVLNVRFVAETKEAKEIVESGIVQLRNILGQNGFQMGRIVVAIGGDAPGRGGGSWGKRDSYGKGSDGSPSRDDGRSSDDPTRDEVDIVT